MTVKYYSGATVKIEGSGTAYKVRDFTWDPATDDRPHHVWSREYLGEPISRDSFSHMADAAMYARAAASRKKKMPEGHPSGCTCRKDCGGFWGINRTTEARRYTLGTIEMRECRCCQTWSDPRTGHDCSRGIRGERFDSVIVDDHLG